MTYQFFPDHKVVVQHRRRPQRVALEPRDAARHAMGLLRDQKVSALAYRLVDALAAAGVLNERQLKSLVPVSPRSLLRYYKEHLIDRVPTHGLPLARYGFASSERLYTLGMVGIALAEMRTGEEVPKGYLGFGLHRVMHDLVASEVVIRLAQRALEMGLSPGWKSRYAATVAGSKDARLQPDALLDLGNLKLVLEYHNEDVGRRARHKVRRYERAYRDGVWRDSWSTERFPLVLVAFTHQAVATGYRAAVDRQAALGLRCRFLGKSWTSFRRGHDPALWSDFRTGQVVNVLTGEEVR